MKEKLEKLGFFSKIPNFWGNGEYFIDLRDLKDIRVTKNQEPFCNGDWDTIIPKLENAILPIKV